MSCPRPHRAWRGFTLIELLAVLAILAALVAMAMPMAELAARREREAELKRGLWAIRDAIDQYKHMADAGLIPQAPPSGYPPDLQTLVDGVRTNTATTAYLLRAIPQDPFASAAADGGWALRSYQSPPGHPAPGPDVFDVHTRSPETGLDGVPLAQW